jgi:type IV secretory pathway VirB10-like protein
MSKPPSPMAFGHPLLSALQVKRINPLAFVALGMVAIPVLFVFCSILTPKQMMNAGAGSNMFEVPQTSKPPQLSKSAALPQLTVAPPQVAPAAAPAPEPAARVVELVPTAPSFPSSTAPARAAESAQSERRREAFLSAVGSSMRPAQSGGGAEPVLAQAAPDPYNAAIAQVLGRYPTQPGASPDTQLISAGQSRAAGKLAAAELAANPAGPDRNEHVLLAVPEPPRSPYILSEGTVVPCVLEAGINSDLPGMLRARVSRAVYDSATGRYLLLPQGTLVSGQYDSAVAYGQSRLLVKAERLVFPDSSSLDLQGMPVGDPLGMAGFTGKVNRRLFATFGSALLLGAISGGTQVGQGSFDRSQGESPRQILAAAASQNVSEVSSEMVRRQLAVQPTIEIQPGYQFNLVVSKDIIFAEPWQPTYFESESKDLIYR